MYFCFRNKSVIALMNGKIFQVSLKCDDFIGPRNNGNNYTEFYINCNKKTLLPRK